MEENGTRSKIVGLSCSEAWDVCLWNGSFLCNLLHSYLGVSPVEHSGTYL